MNPAFSIIFFTTLAGAGQGLACALAVGQLSGALRPDGLALKAGLAAAFLLVLAGLVASFFHLGRPLRAWRAAAMWRTSWMSREVIVLPAFLLLLAGWLLAALTGTGAASPAWPLLTVACALLLWYCTAMIYACLKFVQEWAHPLTPINYTLIGLANGTVLALAVAQAAGEAPWARALLPAALVLTLAAWVGRTLALRRNDRLKPVSTLQSATGLSGSPLRQQSMGFSGGSFNTREFFHGRTLQALRAVRGSFQVLAFAVPAGLLAALLWGAPAALVWLAVATQLPGVLAERWFFFAQARHPQNLYYQVVS